MPQKYANKQRTCQIKPDGRGKYHGPCELRTQVVRRLS
jgi:hypothetical protein